MRSEAANEIRRLASEVLLGLDPAPAAIPIRLDSRISQDDGTDRVEKLAGSARCTDRLLADHSEAHGSPRTQAGQTRVQARTLGGPATDGPRTLARQPRVSGTAGLRLRPRRQEASGRPWTGRERTSPGRDRGGDSRNSRSGLGSVQSCTKIEVPTPPRDPFPRRCPLCRKRKRQLIAHDERGERIERMLCGPCQRMLRIRHWDRAWLQGRFIDLDPPAPLCHACWHRPRISKGTRRGRKRYFRFCGPCDRARRAVLGKPAYRGERGLDREERNQLRAPERRIRYPWPHNDADPVRVRPSPFAPSSSREELLASTTPAGPQKASTPPKPALHEGLPTTRRRRGRGRNYRLIALWAITDAWRAAAAAGSSARATCAGEFAQILASIEPAQLVDRSALVHGGRAIETLPVNGGHAHPSRKDLRPAGSEPNLVGPTGSRPPPRGPDALYFNASPPPHDRPLARADGRGVAWPRFNGGSPCPNPSAAHAVRGRAS